MNNVNSDWTIEKSQIDQSVSRQSNWSPEPVRTISAKLAKSNAWDESTDDQSNMKKYINKYNSRILNIIFYC